MRQFQGDAERVLCAPHSLSLASKLDQLVQIGEGLDVAVPEMTKLRAVSRPNNVLLLVEHYGFTIVDILSGTSL